MWWFARDHSLIFFSLVLFNPKPFFQRTIRRMLPSCRSVFTLVRPPSTTPTPNPLCHPHGPFTYLSTSPYPILSVEQTDVFFFTLSPRSNIVGSAEGGKSLWHQYQLFLIFHVEGLGLYWLSTSLTTANGRRGSGGQRFTGWIRKVRMGNYIGISNCKMSTSRERIRMLFDRLIT